MFIGRHLHHIPYFLILFIMGAIGISGIISGCSPTHLCEDEDIHKKEKYIHARQFLEGVVANLSQADIEMISSNDYNGQKENFVTTVRIRYGRDFKKVKHNVETTY